MIVVLTGTNMFAVRQTLQKITDDSSVTPERYEASDIELPQLVDILQGQSLFSERRLAIIDDASQDKSFWSSLKDVLPRADPDTTLVLVAASPDRRTATYKWLQKNANIIDHPWWRGSDSVVAKKWLVGYAKQLDVQLSSVMADEMIARATRGADDGKPVIDQQQLANAIKQLSYGTGGVTTDSIGAVLAPSTHENIFELLAAALRRDTATVQMMVDRLSQSEDGHRAMGLLVSQVTNLTALVLSDDSMSLDQIAHDIEAHPFALRQLTRYASQLARTDLVQIVDAIADADVRIKQGQAEPWVMIRTALLTISRK